MKDEKQLIIFSISLTQIRTLLKSDPELKPNSGSAFSNIWADESQEGTAADIPSYLSNAEFIKALRIITKPDLYLNSLIVGAATMTDIRVHQRKSEGNFVAVTEFDMKENYTIVLFENYQVWLTWWLSTFTVQVDQPAANFIPPIVTLEGFVLVLHTLDSFSRVSYQNLLDHNYMDKVYIKEEDFFTSMSDNIKSKDIRWLLPNFLMVMPETLQHTTNISKADFETLFTYEFLRPAKTSSGEDVFAFGESGQIMGVEFFRSWSTGCGIEVNVGQEGIFKAKERIYIAPTILGNHFARLEEKEGTVNVNHQLYTAQQLQIKMEKILESVFTVDGSDVLQMND